MRVLAPVFAAERGVRSRGVAYQNRLASQVVPRRGIAPLVVLQDRVGQKLLCLSELRPALIGFCDRGNQGLYRVINL